MCGSLDDPDRPPPYGDPLASGDARQIVSYQSQKSDNSVTQFLCTVSDVSTTVASRRSANRRRRSEAREQILDAAREELRTTAFRDLSVEDLMKATGLSRTAFYRYFPDREAVLVELLVELRDSLIDDRDVEGTGVRAGTLRELGALLADNRGVLKAIADAAPGDEDVEAAYRAFMHDCWIVVLTDRITDAQERGFAIGLDPDLAGEALGWMAERMVTQTLSRDPHVVLDTIVAILARCIYSGAQPDALGGVSSPGMGELAAAV
jgi:AcrR family transcriptional regulator